ncbi:MAG: lamin tail domain-containing protein [Sedimentisphaerales bacterium]
MYEYTRNLFFGLVITAYLFGSVSTAETSLVINELMASNNSCIQDPQGQYDDWVEIYNYGIDAIDMGGMYLTDNPSSPTKWQIPGSNPAATTIAAGSYLLIWADNDTSDAGLHANFKLDADGEQIALFDSDGSTLIDSMIYPDQNTDISYGRYPDGNDDWGFFDLPSPGAENSGGYLNKVDAPKFSQNHGFYDTAFYVTIATETEDATIYYTLDGSEPYIFGGRLPSGTIYTEPISITKTTCLRATAIKTGSEPSEIKTRTYIFVSDVARQSPTGIEPGPGWPTGSINSQVIDYGMDPDVVNDPQYKNLINDSLLAVPSFSFVTDLEHLFDPATGIYVNAMQEGRAWERPVSVELLNPDGSEGFQIDAGFRIRGGWRRRPFNPKHPFRLFFRAEYGESKLRFPLFEDEGADEFENVDMRTSQNYSWASDGDSQNTMVREVYSRDVQGLMGHPYTRSRYYHLYINGHYWGLHQTQERSEASFAESYFGGDKDDYDVAKMEREQGNAMIATDGNLDAFRRLYDATRAGLGDNAAYYRVQGMNPDGTPNPDYERLLDVDNLIDFMIIEYYTGDRDGPGSRFGNIPNNTYGIYNRKNPDGWKWFHHDNEHTLGVRESEQNMVTPFTSAGAQFRYFNPHWLHEQLITNNADYRLHFADHVYKHFFNDGLLTLSVSRGLIQARADQIEMAIVAESARWGDAKRSTPFTRDQHWRPEVNRILNYLQSRTNVVLNQFKNVGWYPNIQPPTLSHSGGQINSSLNLTMSTSTGKIYYTLDGNDPRTSDTPQQANALVPENADKRAIVPIGDISENWKGGGVFEDSAWLSCTGSPGGVGFERTSGYQNFITLDLIEQMYARNATCYVRIPFTIDTSYTSLTLNVRYDDGFVAYINGVEVARRNFNGTPAWNSRASASHSDSAAVLLENIDISNFLDTLQQGDNLLALHAMNSSTTSSDFLISAELLASGGDSDDSGADGVMEYTGPITLPHSVQVKARVLSGETWSALNEAVFAVGPVAENLRITEIMYNPPDPNEEFIELQNIGAETINLNLVSFTNGIDFTFPNTELAAGEHIVVVQNHNIFEARYGTNVNIAGQYSGKLNNAGERIELQDAIGRMILDFRYEDDWRSITDGEGFSLTIIDATNPDLSSWDEKDSWRPSAYAGGSPDSDDSGILPEPGAIVINEVLAHSHAEASDWIELYNATGTAIDIGGWFLSDSNDNLFKYEIANGTTIGPNGYLVLYEDLNFGNTNNPGAYESFALSENGEQLYLSSTQNDVLTGYRNVEDFGASETGVSFGCYVGAGPRACPGQPHGVAPTFVALEQNTPGSANAYPKVGPIVISEIMYNPNWPEGGSYTNDQYEYIELQNISVEPVTLYRYDKGQPWKFTDGIEFTFPADVPVTIGAGGHLLVVKKPAAFSWRYPDVPANIILGPYDGNLSNAGESLELSMPGDVDKEGVRQYIRVDRVNYSDGSHPENAPAGEDLWPTDTDGYGMALKRKVLTDYGNDPDNWTAAPAWPGK